MHLKRYSEFFLLVTDTTNFLTRKNINEDKLLLEQRERERKNNLDGSILSKSINLN